MKKKLRIAMLMLLATSMAACADKGPQENVKADSAVQAGQPAAPASNLSVERSAMSTTVATIEGIDLKTRMVKLRSLEGRLFTIHVGEEAINLPQAKVGDKVEITYAQSLEVRMAEPGEVRNETGTLIGGAKPGSKPAGVEITETIITATILALDKVNELATLKMADGSVATVKVQNPANLHKVKVGDTIAITYIEAVGIKVIGKKR
jgi:predicted small lipoprotein YifL